MFQVSANFHCPVDSGHTQHISLILYGEAVWLMHVLYPVCEQKISVWQFLSFLRSFTQPQEEAEELGGLSHLHPY